MEQVTANFINKISNGKNLIRLTDSSTLYKIGFQNVVRWNI